MSKHWRDRLSEAPVGTQAPSFSGGHWLKIEWTPGSTGWKWMPNGSTFPTPGGDWNGKLIYPEEQGDDLGYA